MCCCRYILYTDINYTICAPHKCLKIVFNVFILTETGGGYEFTGGYTHIVLGIKCTTPLIHTYNTGIIFSVQPTKLYHLKTSMHLNISFKKVYTKTRGSSHQNGVAFFGPLNHCNQQSIVPKMPALQMISKWCPRRIPFYTFSDHNNWTIKHFLKPRL